MKGGLFAGRGRFVQVTMLKAHVLLKTTFNAKLNCCHRTIRQALRRESAR